ncbi:MAG: 50S ribosomal protein L29 [Chlamydiae bacterium]|nr:50S ribosomal protein L29 [Chlamydiota bacterium]
MDQVEFKDQTVEELKALYIDLSKEIYELKNEINLTRKIEKPHLIKKKKRDRARILTFLRQKEKK